MFKVKKYVNIKRSVIFFFEKDLKMVCGGCVFIFFVVYRLVFTFVIRCVRGRE